MGRIDDRNIFEFLDGSESYDGVWFGDKHPTEGGQFWWRKYLKQAVYERDARIKELEASAEFNKEVVEHCERVEAELIRIKEDAKWISVEERLPRACEHVLLYNADDLHSIGWLANKHFYTQDGCEDEHGREIFPTHWMPLPAPPNLKSDLDRLMKGGE